MRATVTHRTKLILFAPGVATLVVSAAVWLLCAPRAAAELGHGSGPSPVIFPIQTLPLSFSHAKHIARDKMSCDYCHEDAPDSKSAADDNIPKESSCATCHDIDRTQPNKTPAEGKPSGRCGLCHVGFDPAHPADVARIVIPTPNLKFNHKVHVSQKIRCQTCHGDPIKDEIDLATRNQLPRMNLCLGCHDGKKAPSRCATCHVTEPSGVLKTTFPDGQLTPSGALRGDAHDPMFSTEHARVAQNDDKYCANCHRKEFCSDCHSGVSKPMSIHGNDYVARHPVDARRNDPDCSACHRLQTFCTGCHARSGIQPPCSQTLRDAKAPCVEPKTGQFDSEEDPVTGKRRAFHPTGWSPADGGVPSQHHSFQAQRNIRQCVSCHRESFCMQCHSGKPPESGAAVKIGVSPHPLDWRGSAKCKALLSKNGRMCLKCHINADDARCE